MILAKDFEDFVKLLNHHKVEYMIVGGYALAFHGKPRQASGRSQDLSDIKEIKKKATKKGRGRKL